MNNVMYTKCTKGDPWNKSLKPGQVVHPDAREIHGSQCDGYPGGDIITMECPNCVHRWTQELPQ